MKVVVIALLESIVSIFNVVIVVLLIWIMFAILGMNLLSGRMGYCNISNYYGVSESLCPPGLWTQRTYTFDDIS